MNRYKMGETRRREITLEPGLYQQGNDVIELTKPTKVWAIEKMRYQYPSLQEGLGWCFEKYDWDAYFDAAASQVVAAVLEPPPISWWRRLLGLGPKLPKAQVLQ